MTEQQIFEALREFVREYGTPTPYYSDVVWYRWEPDSSEANYVEVQVSPDTPLMEITVRYATEHNGRVIEIDNPVIHIDDAGEMFRFHGDFYRIDWEAELGL